MVRQMGDVRLYSVQDLNEGLGIHGRTIRTWFNKGRLRGVKLGREWFVTEENLKAFLSGEAEERGGEKEKPKKTRQLRSLKRKQRKEVRP